MVATPEVGEERDLKVQNGPETIPSLVPHLRQQGLDEAEIRTVLSQPNPRIFENFHTVEKGMDKIRQWMGEGNRKVILVIGGPENAGKTTLAKRISLEGLGGEPDSIEVLHEDRTPLGEEAKLEAVKTTMADFLASPKNTLIYEGMEALRRFEKVRKDFGPREYGAYGILLAGDGPTLPGKRFMIPMKLTQ